uniref:Uncharacterized protein n=1 Tax=Athene cunicularia TaxID=194338 RepID=A0A663N1B8_ATHCN
MLLIFLSLLLELATYCSPLDNGLLRIPLVGWLLWECFRNLETPYFCIKDVTLYTGRT